MYDQAFGVLQAVMMSETENTSIAISETENSSQTTSTALPTATDSLSGEMTDPIQSMGDDVQDSLTDSAQDAATDFAEDTTADAEDAAQEMFHNASHGIRLAELHSEGCKNEKINGTNRDNCTGIFLFLRNRG